MNDGNVIVKFNTTGICEVDVSLVIKQWSHLWFVYKNTNVYRLVKMLRKDSQIRRVKVEISRHQAREIIKALELVETRHPVFRKASTYRKQLT